MEGAVDARATGKNTAESRLFGQRYSRPDLVCSAINRDRFYNQRNAVEAVIPGESSHRLRSFSFAVERLIGGSALDYCEFAVAFGG